MTRSGWELKAGPEIKYYFPKGVPGQCPNGKEWEIDEQTGYLKPHPDHSQNWVKSSQIDSRAVGAI